MPLDLQKLKEDACKQRANPPLSESAVRDAECALGFLIPAPLRRLYTEIGNGGFGPRSGLFGLNSGMEQIPNESVVCLYTLFMRGDPEDPSFYWPYRPLPILDWGCAIRSCVDCSIPSLPMIRHDPNVSGLYQFRSENFDLETWLQAWLDGFDLWKME